MIKEMKHEYIFVNSIIFKSTRPKSAFQNLIQIWWKKINAKVVFFYFKGISITLFTNNKTSFDQIFTKIQKVPKIEFQSKSMHFFFDFLRFIREIATIKGDPLGVFEDFYFYVIKSRKLKKKYQFSDKYHHFINNITNTTYISIINTY